MNISYALLISFVAGFSTLIGTIPIFFKINPKSEENYVITCMIISTTIMIGISITDLLPEAFKYYSSNIGYQILIFIIVYIIIKILVLYIKMPLGYYRVGILSMISLMLHNFPEGIITFLGSMMDAKLGVKLGIAIALHNIPEGLAIAMPIYYATKSKKKAIKETLISSLSEPFGALIAYFFLKDYLTNKLLSFILVGVASIMFAISIEELIPQIKKRSSLNNMIIGILIGLLILFLNMIIT